MKCSKCGSDSWRLTNYDTYTDTFVYECLSCGNIYPPNNKEVVNANKSITTDKTYVNDKQYNDRYGYTAIHHCPKCGSIMYYTTADGQLHCDKCEGFFKLNSSNNATKMCPKCGNKMTLQTSGNFFCKKCGLTSFSVTYPPYAIPYDSNISISNNISPNEITIESEKITMTDKTIGIQIDISKQILDNTDSIVINGIKYVKENKE